MTRIVANASELRSAISTVAESVGSAEAMFMSVERKIQNALATARTESEKARVEHELAAFQQKARTALAQIRGNAQRTNAAFSQRLSLVTEKRG